MAASTLLWQAAAPCALSCRPDQSRSLCGCAESTLAVVRCLGGVRDRPILRLYLSVYSIEKSGGRV